VPKTEEEQLGVFDLCGRTYFQRVWIVQEIVLAKKLHYVCGDLICSLDAFVKLCALWSLIWYSFLRYPMSDMPAELAEPKDGLGGCDYENSPQEILAKLVPTSRFKECGQIHDRVYAMLEMLPKPFEFDIDYKMSTEELMIRTEIFIISVSTRPRSMN
jgi:hypothetical protein